MKDFQVTCHEIAQPDGCESAVVTNVECAAVFVEGVKTFATLTVGP